MPTETVHRLRELLPGDAFTPLPSTDIDPTLLPLADGPPFLRVIDSADAPDPELPPAA
jgi:hypothetical protein